MPESPDEKPAELRDAYVRLALPYAQRALHLLDQNPYSPTYGCFDRNYWHYRTMDFPCGMSQQMALLLALVYRHDFPGNPYHKVERIRELAVAASSFAVKSAHSDGSCDDYFPFERALGGLVFSLYALTETYRILENDDEKTLSFLLKRTHLLQNQNESGKLANHQALAALAALDIHLLTGDATAQQIAEDRIELTLSWQHPEEGWFQEYEGADPGYQTCTIDFLAKYRNKTIKHKGKRIPELDKALLKAIDFSSLFMHPDGSYGGEYGSRNTSHFFPHGFELLATFSEKASRITNAFLCGVDKGKAYRNDDDRMAPLPANSYLQAWLDRHSGNPTDSPDTLEPETIHLKDCGLLVLRSEGEHGSKTKRHLVANLHKGGVVKIYDQQGPIASDTGIIGELKDGTILVSHLFQDELTVEQVKTDKGITQWIVRGFLCKRSPNLMTPAKGLLFRLWCISLGRLNPRWTRQLVQKLAITGKKLTPHRFERIIEAHNDRIDIRDYLPTHLPFRRIAIGSDATSIYVAGSLSLHESRLCPWQEANWNELPSEKNRKVWSRSYFRGSGHSPDPKKT